MAAALLLAQAESPYARWERGPSRDPAFFPVGVWLQNPSQARRYREAGINTYVGLWNGPTAAQLDALREAGMKAVCAQNALALSRLDDPTIIAWMHGDEPDNAQPKEGGGYGPPVAPAKIVEDFGRMRTADPGRPVLLNLGQGVAWDDWIGRGVRSRHPEDYPEYLKGCDIASFDIYPAVHAHPAVAGKLEFVPRGVARLRAWGGPAKIVWTCIEASRIDNERVKPTAAQIRAEVWMALIRGARGIVYFVHQFKPAFVEASLLRDPELLAGVAAVNAEIRALAPALNATAQDELVAVDPPLIATARRLNGVLHVFAAVEGPAGGEHAIRIKATATEAEAIGEGRSVPIRDGVLRDRFDAYGVRLYRLR